MRLAIRAAVLLLVVASLAVGQSDRTGGRTTSVPSQAGSEWHNRIDLDRFLSDPAALDRLVIIYRPTYRQTWFVFGTGRVVLQTYPPGCFPQRETLLPTCTADKSRDEIREVIRTMARAQFFDLPEKSFVDTGDEDNEIEFQKAVKLHSIVVDDGASRAHRDFAEGKYQGRDEKIPAAFGDIEGALRWVASSLLNGAPCPMAHYMEWRRTGRGEAIRQ